MNSVRCAIYTRKSSEEGLEQSFNSLDAQREACEAYIRSQRHEGWRVIPTQYDDGGFSGGNMDRPAVKRLMADIEAHKVNVVVVYKVDRLTRSLSDFARIIERFDKHQVSFVSVTQQFNTTSSMGRLTLNVLLSFAQFEREMISERTRAKMAAARRKGQWMGGRPVLGYDVAAEGAGLTVNQAEAAQVRAIYRLYLELGSPRRVLEEMECRGWRLKAYTTRQGRPAGHARFTRPTLHHLLTNPLYTGRVRHRGQTWPGEQERILGDRLWNEVQRRLNRPQRRAGTPSRRPAARCCRGWFIVLPAIWR